MLSNRAFRPVNVPAVGSTSANYVSSASICTATLKTAPERRSKSSMPECWRKWKRRKEAMTGNIVAQGIKKENRERKETTMMALRMKVSQATRIASQSRTSWASLQRKNRRILPFSATKPENLATSQLRPGRWPWAQSETVNCSFQRQKNHDLSALSSLLIIN